MKLGTSIQFGQWVFDTQHDELKNISTLKVQKLEPQVAQLLMVFIEQRTVTLSRQALSQILWSDTIVDDNSLYQVLTKLRKVLNDDARRPKYIKTIPKKGYVFFADVKSFLQSENTTEIDKRDHTKGLMNYFSLHYKWLLSLPIIIICFSSIAFFSSDRKDTLTPTYQLHDISFELGLEFDVAAHYQKNLIAYIENLKELVIANKEGDVLHRHTFMTRIAAPSWHQDEQKVAFWQYVQDKCQMIVMNVQGKTLHTSPVVSCQKVKAPIWQDDGSLIVIIESEGTSIAYKYWLQTSTFAAIPVPLKNSEKLIAAVKGWHGETYYLAEDKKRHSFLVTLDKTRHIQWPYPIWLVAFDPKHQAMISNDGTVHNNLIARTRSGQEYSLMKSPQGLFSRVSIDSEGSVFVAAESWQVNIRDQDNLPIFASSSIDYLPVTNFLGETAFMSKRTGICEVYIHANNQVKRLSFDDTKEKVHILKWSPKAANLLSNRGNEIVIYDRNRSLAHFSSQLDLPLKFAGWLSPSHVWASSSKQVNIFTSEGQLIETFELEADLLVYQHEQDKWLLVQQHKMYILDSLKQPLSESIQGLTLTKQQINNIRDVKIKDNTLYWLSDWSKEDYIWKLDMAKFSDVELIKKGELIWHYDISPKGNLLLAKMESVEGDIKKFALVD